MANNCSGSVNKPLLAPAWRRCQGWQILEKRLARQLEQSKVRDRIRRKEDHPCRIQITQQCGQPEALLAQLQALGPTLARHMRKQPPGVMQFPLLTNGLCVQVEVAKLQRPVSISCGPTISADWNVFTAAPAQRYPQELFPKRAPCLAPWPV